MNASMVRIGGIMTFVVIAVAIIGAFLVGGSRIGAIIVNLITTALVLFVFWSTKGLFNALNYRRADIPIIGIMALLILTWVIGLVGGAGIGAMTSPQALGQTLGVIGIISLLVLLATFVLWLLFSIQSMGFGNAGGGGLWKAIGILYLISMILIILTIVLMIIGAAAGSAGLMATGGVIIFIALLVMLAAWICHGIGLIMGAGKMPA